jgi:hypothetical protein
MINPPVRIDASASGLTTVILRGPETAVSDTLIVARISLGPESVTPLTVTPGPALTIVDDVKPVPTSAIL